MTKVQVMAFTDAHDDMSHAVYDIKLVATAQTTSSAPSSPTRPAFREFFNIVHGSLKCKTVTPKYNELQLNFGDSAYGYQLNTATVFSEKHQVLFGTAGHRTILTQSYNLTLTPTMDQSVRAGAKKLKDELGGINQQQWQVYREITFQSGFFMNELEIGDITYVEHSLIPNGGDWFRVRKWEIDENWVISWTMRTFQSNNYDESGAPE